MKKQVKIGLGAAALALAAALCAGGTLAGWRTSSTVTNHISTATVQGIVEEKYEQGQTITPGQTVEKCVWVKNTGTASSLVRAKVVIDWDDETAADMDATDCVFPAYNTADWTQGEDGYWYYNDIVEPNQCSTALFESFTVSPNLTSELAGRTGHIGVTMELLQASGDSPTLWGRTWSAYRRTPDAVAAKTQTAHIRFTYDENAIKRQINPMPCAVSAAQGILCFRRWKAEKKLSLVVLPAAPAVGLVGGGGCGQPLADRRLKLGAGRTERRAGRAFCFAMDRAQRTVLAAFYADLCSCRSRACLRQVQHTPRRGAWLRLLGRCVRAESKI